MSAKNTKHCELTYPIVKYEKQTIKLDDKLKQKWTTETLEAFKHTKREEKQIGKRRELLMNYFRIQAAKDALEEIIGDHPLPEEKCSTEYINNYCDENFVPLMDKTEFDIQKLANNPLYSGNVQTIYKEQFEKKNYKVNSEFRNEKRPFVRRSLFTTPPEIAMEEPLNGF